METLTKYKQQGSFNFYSLPIKKDCYRDCEAPTDASGVYLVFGLKGGKEELVYIGRSGKKLADGTIQHRKVNLGGIKDRLVNGKYTHSVTNISVPRYEFWKEMMFKDGFDKLLIRWFVTHSDEYCDCPSIVEDRLIKSHRPRWNRI